MKNTIKLLTLSFGMILATPSFGMFKSLQNRFANFQTALNQKRSDFKYWTLTAGVRDYCKAEDGSGHIFIHYPQIHDQYIALKRVAANPVRYWQSESEAKRVAEMWARRFNHMKTANEENLYYAMRSSSPWERFQAKRKYVASAIHAQHFSKISEKLNALKK